MNDTIMAFREFCGKDPIYYFHPDNAKELKAAAEQELMAHPTSTPHRPESNGVVERFNQLIVDGARCLLRPVRLLGVSISEGLTQTNSYVILKGGNYVSYPYNCIGSLPESLTQGFLVGKLLVGGLGVLQSGLPGRCSHYACKAFLLARYACVKGKDGRTAWDRRFGKEPHGKLIPFGSKVIYPRPKHDAAKFAPRGSEGIMLGHHLEPGGFFKGDYLVLNIDNLLTEGNPKSTIHTVKEVVKALGPNTYVPPA